jgi:serine/threonine protein kinase
MTTLVEPAEARLPRVPAGAPLARGYRAIALLSRNRTLDVYEAWSEERDCHCMVKRLRPDQLDDVAARRRLLREGRLLLRLTHPHIVRAYELLREPEPAVVLETVGGETLSHLIRRRRRSERRLSAGEVAELGLQLASALGYLHGHGALHLDVKPGNVIAEGGRARLIDLSLVRRPGRGVPGRGSRPYLSPEQAAGRPFGPATDVWGLGSLLYKALAGVSPFSLDDPRRYPQLEERAPSVRASRRLPGALAGAVDACLEPEPAGRPTLGDLAEVLEELA